MSTQVQILLERLRRLPFPALGKVIGDFPLYDALIAGCADRAARGEVVAESEVPVPDDETARHAAALKAKADPSQEEAAFLDYFDLLAQVRQALHQRNLQ
jgi:hypothetical protein